MRQTMLNYGNRMYAKRLLRTGGNYENCGLSLYSHLRRNPENLDDLSKEQGEKFHHTTSHERKAPRDVGIAHHS